MTDDPTTPDTLAGYDPVAAPDEQATPTEVLEPDEIDYHEAPEGSEWEDDEHDTLPPRPRRRLITPVTLVLGALIVAALGFVGGVQVQKNQGSSGGGTAARSGFPAGLSGGVPSGAPGAGGTTGGPAGAAGGPAGAGGATTGTVSNKDGRTLYVKNSAGTTVKVKAGDSAKVTRVASASVGAIQPGDTVIVEGTKAASGTVTASSITATADGVSLLSALGGGGGFPGGAAPGGGPAGGG